MKLLLENWRQYLNEGAAEDKYNFGNIVIDDLTTDDDRHIVVVKTDDGPVAFYRSTGTGTGSWTKGMYIPFGGVSPDGPGNASPYWYAKMPSSHPQSGTRSSKVPKEGSEFAKISKYLSEKFGTSAKGQSIHDFMKANGYKSTEEMGIEPSPFWGNPIYDSIAINVFLKKYGALGALDDKYSFYGIDDIPSKKFPSGMFPKAENK